MLRNYDKITLYSRFSHWYIANNVMRNAKHKNKIMLPCFSRYTVLMQWAFRPSFIATMVGSLELNNPSCGFILLFLRILSMAPVDFWSRRCDVTRRSWTHLCSWKASSLLLGQARIFLDYACRLNPARNLRLWSQSDSDSHFVRAVHDVTLSHSKLLAYYMPHDSARKLQM